MGSKIKFYEIRSMKECISVTNTFICWNWKILAQNILYIGLPLILFVEYVKSTYLLKASMSIFYFPFGTLSWIECSIYQILSILPPIFFFSMIGVTLKKYTTNLSIQPISWVDEKKNLFSFMGKLFIQWLIIVILLFLITKLTSRLIAWLIMIVAFTSSGDIVVLGLFGLLCLLALAVFHPIILSVFPVFFEGASAWQGLRKGLRLGFKYWRSNFCAILLGCVFIFLINYIIAIPFIILEKTGLDIAKTVLLIFISLGGLITYPIIAIFLSFHYGSIKEQEQLEYSMQIKQIEIQEEKIKEFESEKIKKIEKERMRLRKEREDPNRFMPK
ncbi:hypothetical protein FACS18947_6200 [Bacteroidia bacterium]|nr:hypothetical protein FACS18947_6200 [Bacteroidia bacterium]